MTSKVFIGLTNPKSPSNVGAALRAAGCYGAHSVMYSGRRYEHAAKFQQDTNQIGRDMPLKAVNCLLDAVPQGAKVVCVEFAEGAVPLPEFVHPDQAYYLFGPEDGSLSQQVVDRADAVVYIPTVGCMNLAATVNVVLYDRLAKAGRFTTDNELIISSRDTNNQLRV